MRVAAQDLHRLLYNALLFTSDKSSAGGRFWLHTKRDGMLYATATDDHVILRDRVRVSGVVDFGRWVDLAPAKEIEKALRLLGDELDVERALGEEVQYPPPDDIWTTALDMVWDFQTGNLGTGDAYRLAGPFALNPARLRKFSLVKPGTYPIDMCDTLYESQRIIRWRAGPDAHGVIAPLNREYLEETYKDEPGVLWMD